MSPKLINPPTSHKLNRIRRAALAAVALMAPAGLPDASADLVAGVAGSTVSADPGPMEFAPGRDTMRDEIAAKFDAYGFPIPPAPALPLDITRENGILTCRNLKRGTTAVFRVETLDRGNLAGRRIVSVWSDGRWDGFGFVDDFGIHVWGRKSGGLTPSTYDRYASFLTDLTGAMAKGVRVEFTLD